jgi:hypothetical protein
MYISRTRRPRGMIHEEGRLTGRDLGIPRGIGVDIPRERGQVSSRGKGGHTPRNICRVARGMPPQEVHLLTKSQGTRLTGDLRPSRNITETHPSGDLRLVVNPRIVTRLGNTILAWEISVLRRVDQRVPLLQAVMNLLRMVGSTRRRVQVAQGKEWEVVVDPRRSLPPRLTTPLPGIILTRQHLGMDRECQLRPLRERHHRIQVVRVPELNLQTAARIPHQTISDLVERGPHHTNPQGRVAKGRPLPIHPIDQTVCPKHNPFQWIPPRIGGIRARIEATELVWERVTRLAQEVLMAGDILHTVLQAIQDMIVRLTGIGDMIHLVIGALRDIPIPLPRDLARFHRVIHLLGDLLQEFRDLAHIMEQDL